MTKCAITHESSDFTRGRFMKLVILRTLKMALFPVPNVNSHNQCVWRCVSVDTKASVVTFARIFACFCEVCGRQSAAAWPLCPTGGSQWGRGGDARVLCVRVCAEEVKVDVWPLTSVTRLDWAVGWSLNWNDGCSRGNIGVQLFF